MAGAKKLPALAAILAVPKGGKGGSKPEDEELEPADDGEGEEPDAEEGDFDEAAIEAGRACMEAAKGDDPAAFLRTLKDVIDILREHG